MCYRRAETNDDREGIAFTELARLYLDAGDRQQVNAFVCLGGVWGGLRNYCQSMLAQREAHSDALQPLPLSCTRTGGASAPLLLPVAPPSGPLCPPPPPFVLFEQAAHYYQSMLAQREAHGDATGKEVAEALLFLANYCKDTGQASPE
jgi:hypothetical protein